MCLGGLGEEGEVAHESCWRPDNLTSHGCERKVVVCEEGTTGPLCGATESGYLWSELMRTATPCPADQYQRSLATMGGMVVALGVGGTVYSYRAAVHAILAQKLGKFYVVFAAIFTKALGGGRSKVIYTTMSILVSMEYGVWSMERIGHGRWPMLAEYDGMLREEKG